MQQASRVSKQRATKTFPRKNPRHWPSKALLHERLVKGSLGVQCLHPCVQTTAFPLCLPLETCAGKGRASPDLTSPKGTRRLCGSSSRTHQPGLALHRKISGLSTGLATGSEATDRIWELLVSKMRSGMCRSSESCQTCQHR